AYVWWRRPVADLPVIDWSQADPAVVEVIEAARAAVRQSPRSGAAWGKLGMTLFAHYLVPEAQVCFVQAQRFEPNEPRWPYYLAEILRRSDPDAAIPPLRRAVELAGASIEPRLPLAYLLLAQGHLGEAEAEFRRVLEGEPDNAWALQGLGQTMREQGQDAECRALLQRTAANPATAKPIDRWMEPVWELQVGRKAMLQRAETL